MPNVPGSNLLTTALELICAEPFDYIEYTGTSVNEIGFDVRTYAAPVTVRGSVQAVDRTEYDQLGLDWTKRYIRIWTETDIDDLYRDRAGDQVRWHNLLWEVQSEDDWHPIDGWNSFTAVQVDA